MRAVKKPKEQYGKSRIVAIVCLAIEKNNNTHTVQVESFKFASLSFEQGFQIVIPPRSPPIVPEPIGKPSDCILH